MTFSLRVLDREVRRELRDVLLDLKHHHYHIMLERLLCVPGHICVHAESQASMA